MGEILEFPSFDGLESKFFRCRNTDANGKPFSPEIVDLVWAKTDSDYGFISFKRDAAGASIARQEYGMLSQYGWEIDHIIPISAGGTDDIDNLQPLHWENNIAKGNDYPDWKPAKKY